jgi:hypothetical protein
VLQQQPVRAGAVLIRRQNKLPQSFHRRPFAGLTDELQALANLNPALQSVRDVPDIS